MAQAQVPETLVDFIENEDVKEVIRLFVEEYWRKNADFIDFCREHFDECYVFEENNPDHGLFVARSGRIIILHPFDNLEPYEDFEEATLLVLSSDESAKRLLKIMRELDDFLLGLFFPHRKFAEFLADAFAPVHYKVVDYKNEDIVFFVYEFQDL